MRNWLLLLAVFLVGLAIVLGVRSQEIDQNFVMDKASRVRWIDGEILDLKLERICVIRAKDRADMKRCNR